MTTVRQNSAMGKNVMALKRQLADCLGDNGPHYWDALRDFCYGKLNGQNLIFMPTFTLVVNTPIYTTPLFSVLYTTPNQLRRRLQDNALSDGNENEGKTGKITTPKSRN
ncbi:unnamed protein product [Absidia cylindrospora]